LTEVSDSNFSKVRRYTVIKRLLWFPLGILVLAATTQAKHPVTLEDLATLRDADYLQIAPTGDVLAYVMDGDLWLIATKGGSSPRRLGKGAVPVWSPDGRRLAYYSSESGTLQLWVSEPQSGRSTQLTRIDGGISPDPDTRLVGWTHDPLKYSWSPDGTKIVFASQVGLYANVQKDDQLSSVDNHLNSGSGAPLVLTNTTPPEWTLSGIFRSGGFGRPVFRGGTIDRTAVATEKPPMVNQLFVVDSETMAIRQLTQDDGIYFNPDWSPDGQTIVCASSDGSSLVGNGTGTTNLYAIEVPTGRKTALTHGVGDKRLPSWSPDGKWVAFFGGEHFGPQSVFVVPGTGGESRNVSSKLNRYITEFVWDWDSKSVLITYQDGVSWPIARYGTTRDHSENLSRSGVGMHMHPSVARSGETVWQESTASSYGKIYMLHAQNNLPVVLVDLNPQIQEWELGEQEVIHWNNKRGDEMEGVLISPVFYRKGQTYPLIVDAYPQQAASFKGNPMMGNQVWASRGYAIFWPNARAPHVWMNPFKSKQYDQAAKGSKGIEVMFDDVMSGIDELIRQGIVDEKRMGLYGFSNGGGVVNQLVTKTSRFQCAVSVAGAASADWPRQFFLHTMDPMIPTIVGALPWEDPQAYVDLSAVYRLDKVTTPMLLADGDNDSDFLLNTIEMYNGLRYLGRDVTFLRYPNQGHGFEGEALKDFWMRENIFFDKYLKPQPPPN
jgi:dipeptidyl aminopeptidase/acylaminoacyl peptidase